MNNTPNDYSLPSKDNIPAYEVLYQQALKNDEEFHVLKDIREAINKLRKAVENKSHLSVEKILPLKSTSKKSPSY
jgi:hypothetical protein